MEEQASKQETSQGFTPSSPFPHKNSSQDFDPLEPADFFPKYICVYIYRREK